MVVEGCFLSCAWRGGARSLLRDFRATLPRDDVLTRPPCCERSQPTRVQIPMHTTPLSVMHTTPPSAMNTTPPSTMHPTPPSAMHPTSPHRQPYRQLRCEMKCRWVQQPADTFRLTSLQPQHLLQLVVLYFSGLVWVIDVEECICLYGGGGGREVEIGRGDG